MTEAHTPGPWTLFYDSRYSSCIAEVGSFVVSAPHEIHDWQNDAVEEANARLIAAAPDLLEALKRARRYVADLPIVGDADLAVIDAAILKATTPNAGERR